MKKEEIFNVKSNVAGKRQRIVTIPSKQGKRLFKVGERCKIVNSKGYSITKIVYATSKGIQRMVTIPADQWDYFPLGESVTLFPSHQPTKEVKNEPTPTQPTNFY
jgi:hypothetical protein